MSYFLRVFCQSPQLVPSNEITDFIRDGWYFDEPPNFEVQPSAEAENETHWKLIVKLALRSRTTGLDATPTE